MIEFDRAQHIAEDWIVAWNDHDLDRVMTHYADDVTFVSPLIVKRTGREDGALRSKDELRAYFAQSLTPESKLRFQLLAVFAGVSSITLLYRNHRDQEVAETKVLDEHGKARTVFVNHRPSSVADQTTSC